MRLSDKILLSHILLGLMVIIFLFSLISLNLMSLTTYRYFIILVGVYSLTAGIFLSHESEKMEAWMATKLEPQERPSALPLKQYPHPLPVDRILSILLKLEELLREGKINKSVFQKLEDYYANELKKSLEEEHPSVGEPETEPY